MLLLEDPYLYLMMFSAIAVAFGGTWLLRRARARALLTGEPLSLDRSKPRAPPPRGCRPLRPRVGDLRLMPRSDRGSARPGGLLEPVHNRGDRDRDRPLPCGFRSGRRAMRRRDRTRLTRPSPQWLAVRPVATVSARGRDARAASRRCASDRPPAVLDHAGRLSVALRCNSRKPRRWHLALRRSVMASP